MSRCWLAALFVLLPVVPALAVEPSSTEQGDRMVAEYFRSEVDKLDNRGLADIETRNGWESRRAARLIPRP
jgi:hypothetical protein